MIDDDVEVEGLDCPACGAVEGVSVLGHLGRSAWARCRYCGITFNHEEEES